MSLEADIPTTFKADQSRKRADIDRPARHIERSLLQVVSPTDWKTSSLPNPWLDDHSRD
jgi:hypothetical protein